ncbi:MAG: MFS transporter [Thermoanaerobaculia bacterium]
MISDDSDLRRIAAAAFLRSTAIGAMGVLLASLLIERNFDSADIGTVATSGLAGTALVTLAASLWGDRVGRRRFQVLVALAATAGGLALLAVSTPPAAIAAALFGLINAMGRDRGAGLLLDQSMLATVAAPAERTALIARYNVVLDAGLALGALAAALPSLLSERLAIPGAATLRAATIVYSLAMLATAALYATLGVRVERAGAPPPRERLTPASRRVLTRISALFAVDGIAGGFLTATLLAWYFFERFDASPAVVAALFFGARIANAASHLGAAWLARRIGLVRTMVFTHIPSSLLLATVPFAPGFGVAALLFLLREGLVEMDVPTRQSYVLAVVRPEERTFASGVTLLVRTASWAVAPVIAGSLMGRIGAATPIFLCAALKIAYDVALYFAFRGVRPPEEEEKSGAGVDGS